MPPGPQKEYHNAHVLTWPARPRRRGPVAAVGVPSGYRGRLRDPAGPAAGRSPGHGAELYQVPGRCQCRDGPRGDHRPGGPGHRQPGRRALVHHHHPGRARRQRPRRRSGGPPRPGHRHHRYVLVAAVGADRAAAAAAVRWPALSRHPQGPAVLRRRPRRAGRPGQGEGAGHRRRTAGHPVHRRRRLRRGEDGDQRGRRLSARPRPLPPGRGARPARRADGRAARHRQDPARPRGRRRGPRPLLVGVGLGFRGDVRRPGGGPGPGPVRAGPHPRAGDRVHR